MAHFSGNRIPHPIQWLQSKFILGGKRWSVHEWWRGWRSQARCWGPKCESAKGECGSPCVGWGLSWKFFDFLTCKIANLYMSVLVASFCTVCLIFGAPVFFTGGNRLLASTQDRCLWPYNSLWLNKSVQFCCQQMWFNITMQSFLRQIQNVLHFQRMIPQNVLIQTHCITCRRNVFYRQQKTTDGHYKRN